MASRLTHKPVLQEHVLHAVPPEYIENVEETLSLDESELKSEQVAIYNRLKSEISAYDDLIHLIETNVPAAILDEEENGITNITPELIKKSIDIGSSKYPDYAVAWAKYHYKNSGTIESIIFPLLINIRQELFSLSSFIDLESDKTKPGEENKLPKELIDLALLELDRASEYRSRVEKLIYGANEKLEICLIRSLLAWATTRDFDPTRRNTLSSVEIGNNEKLRRIKSTVSALRAVLKLSILTRVTKLETILRSITSIIDDSITREVVYKFYAYLAKLEYTLVSPFANMLDELFSISNDSYCEAFDDLITTVEDELYKVRSKYISILSEHESKLIRKYSSYDGLLTLATQRLKVSKQIALLDKILELIETVATVEELEEYISKWIYTQIRPQLGAKPKPGSEKGGSPNNG